MTAATTNHAPRAMSSADATLERSVPGSRLMADARAVSPVTMAASPTTNPPK
jgi:hypothetical protein